MKRYDFYPRPPRGGRRINQWMDIGDNKFLSTPSARRATGRPRQGAAQRLRISIHALREEGDDILVADYINGTKFLSTPSARRATSARRRRSSSPVNFYPRPPRGGRRVARGGSPVLTGISIHALREEGDALWWMAIKSKEAISIHALREEGDRFGERVTLPVRISIHALREEGDPAKLPMLPHAIKFLSTPSARRATHPLAAATPPDN